MKNADFFKQMTLLFSDKGFSCKNNHYYKELSREVLLFFGFQKSSYGRYCYLERGYCFHSINPYLPYPKFNQLNLNCGRVMTGMGQAIVYENIDEAFMRGLAQTIDEAIKEMIGLFHLGKDEMIQHFLSGAYDRSWYILGNETAAYFGLPQEAFRYHFVRA